MQKFSIKSAVIGFIMGTIGVTTVFAATGISSASLSNTKVYFYGQEVPLENSLVLISKEGEVNARMYMPMRELLEYMNFIVEWDAANNSVNLTMRGNPGIAGNSSNISNIISEGSQGESLQPRA